MQGERLKRRENTPRDMVQIKQDLQCKKFSGGLIMAELRVFGSELACGTWWLAGRAPWLPDFVYIRCHVDGFVVGRCDQSFDLRLSVTRLTPRNCQFGLLIESLQKSKF